MVYLPHWPIPHTLGKCEIDYESVFERMNLVLEKLDNPHKKLSPVIHISGTNGKGSCAALLAKIFSCAGYKTHLLTSPHLHDCNERIILNGEKISDSELFCVMEEGRIAAESFAPKIPLTFAEGFTIGALLAFAKNPADIVIIECGMGGRIDSTNIIEEKLATIIMPISFDHMEYLGNSIERIALEKAMIMRQKTPLIVASQTSKALEIIDILAKDQQAPTYYFEQDFSVLMDEENGEFDFEFFGKNLEGYFENLPKPALAGSHQYINFATAIAAILAIQDQKPNLFKIDEKHIRQGISNVFWPSRIEKVTNGLNKILQNEDSEIWIDGAHNEAGAFSLAGWIKSPTSASSNDYARIDKPISPTSASSNDYARIDPKGGSSEKEKMTFMIVGFSKGKCKKSFLEKFLNIADEIVAVRVDGEPNPEKSQVIFEMIESLGIKSFAADDLLDALYHIAKSVNHEPCRVVICGSLHLARDVKKFGNYNKLKIFSLL